MRLLSRPTCLLVLFALLVVGCAGSRLPSVEPDSLRQVNRVLDGRWARIQKTNGALIEHLKDVRVGADSTTFYHRLEQRQGAIPTDSVSKVVIRGDVGRERGFLAGAAPGIAFATVGVGLWIGGETSEGGGSRLGVALGATMIGVGAVVGLIGGVSGALVDGATNETEWNPVYEAPLDHYLD